MTDPLTHTRAQFDDREHGPVDHGVPAVVRFPLSLGPGLHGTRVNVAEPGAYWLQVDYDDAGQVVVEFTSESARCAKIRGETR